MRSIPPAVLLILSACGVDSPTNAEAEAVDRQQEQYLAGQPVPAFDFSLERDVAIQLYRARNEEVATHTIWRGDTSAIEGDCPSIGYPLPYDTSLTNPLTVEMFELRYRSHGTRHYETGLVEQAEPNGLYSSKNSIATWIRCVYAIDGDLVVAPVYVEGKVTAYPFPVEVNYSTGRVWPAGAPDITLERNSR